MKIFSSWEGKRGIADFVLRADNVASNSGKIFYQPDWIKSLEVLPMLVVRIGKVAKCVEEEFAERYFDRVSLAFSLRASELVDGFPERMRENFDGSFVRWSEWEELESLRRREVEVMKIMSPTETGITERISIPTLEAITEALTEVSRYYLLKIGDWIALPAMAEPWSVAPGNGLMMYEGEEKELIYVGIR